MGYYIKQDGSYYEGDLQTGDTEVPQRPSAEYIWVNGTWVILLTQAQQQQLAILDLAAANAYTAGFTSTATGTELWYDSDTDSQTVINRQYQIALNNPSVYSATTFFTGAPVGTTPVRSKINQAALDSTKIVNYLTASQMVQLGNDLAVAWSAVKAHLWEQQAAVNNATTVTAVQAINW